MLALLEKHLGRQHLQDCSYISPLRGWNQSVTLTTRFFTYTECFSDEALNHPRTAVESHQQKILSVVMSRDSATYVTSCASRTAPQSSSRGMETFWVGATHFYVIRSATITDESAWRYRAYTIAPNAICDASEKPCT